ncbi:MAG TPA: hypothetical protein VN238_08495 [Solirubrobacteraceae bacterium]|nr:hypothetical protein [Solirubrobacteraceae bacterium]
MKLAVRAGAAMAFALLLPTTTALAAQTPSRVYQATFSGTQESRWTLDERGTCTGDDFETHPFSGQGSGTASLKFATKQPSKIVVFRQGRSSRWGFNYEVSPVVASARAKAPVVQGTVTGTHTQTCPNNRTLTRTAPTTGCGARTYRLTVQAALNLPSGKPGQLALEGLDTGAGGSTGATWGDECPYFVGLDRFKAHGDDDPANHIPAGGLLTVRKNVGTGALARGRTLTITGTRTMPYDQTDTQGEITSHLRGETVVRWKLVLKPRRG